MTIGTLAPLRLAPGVVALESEYSSRGRVVEANQIRWRGSNIVPIGGWRQLVGLAEGVGRSIFSWVDNSGVRWTAVGTHIGVFVHDGVDFTDITPAGWTASAPNPGLEIGYGTGWFGTGEYGEPIGDDPDEGSAVVAQAVDFGVVHFDNWGENLVFTSVADGRVYEWVPGDPLGLLIATAPVGVRGLVVTPENHLVVLGQTVAAVKFPRRIAWCSQQDNTDWTASATNTAGDRDIEDNTFPIRGIVFQNQTLIFTQSGLHRLDYLGFPNVYGLVRVAPECGLICPQAVAISSGKVFWRSQHGFFQYDGNQVEPVPCALDRRLVAANIDNVEPARRTLVVGHNELFNEFVFFYPGSGEINPTKYLSWAYLDRYWSEGTLARTAWHDTDEGTLPLAISYSSEDDESALNEHEAGYDRPPVETTPAPFFRSGPIEIGEGEQNVTVHSMVQDVPEGASALRVGLTFKAAPQGATIKTVAPKALDTARGYTDFRGEGRSVEIYVSQLSSQPIAWQWGVARLDVSPGGGR